jgi:hypothetical protein
MYLATIMELFLAREYYPEYKACTWPLPLSLYYSCTDDSSLINIACQLEIIINEIFLGCEYYHEKHGLYFTSITVVFPA